jgi:hypothetical protein
VSTEQPLIITMRHVRAAKMCSRGGRAFAERHGLDWDRFLREGIPAEQLEATGDAMALKLVEIARGRK